MSPSSCGNPMEESEALMVRKRKFDKSRFCVKCKSSRGNLVVCHAVYCKTCFLSLVVYKFRRSLEPSVDASSRRTELKASGSLCVGFSGGLGSTVLLDLVWKSYFAPGRLSEVSGGTAHPRKGAVWKKGIVCYVEVCGAFPEMRDRTEEVRRAVEAYEPLEFVSLRLEDAFDRAWWESVGGPALEDVYVGLSKDLPLLPPPAPTPSCPTAALQTYLSTLPTTTSVTASVRTLTRLLLLHLARSRGASHLVLGTSLTALSVNLISGIAQGEGFAVREQAGEEWSSGKVRVCRPLKEVGMKECAAYMWWCGLSVLVPGTWDVVEGKKDIHGMTRDFIVALERDYPSTVNAIARTCGKLVPKGESAESRCILCQRPIQGGIQAWEANISIRSFSSAPSPSPLQPSLTPHLCYACHTTLNSRGSRAAGRKAIADVVPRMPVWVGEGLGGEGDEVWRGKVVGEEEMKSQIANFLRHDEG